MHESLSSSYCKCNKPGLEAYEGVAVADCRMWMRRRNTSVVSYSFPHPRFTTTDLDNWRRLSSSLNNYPRSSLLLYSYSLAYLCKWVLFRSIFMSIFAQFQPKKNPVAGGIIPESSVHLRIKPRWRATYRRSYQDNIISRGSIPRFVPCSC